MQSSTLVEAAHHRCAERRAVSCQGHDGAVRARLWPHAGQRPAPHPAVLDARLRADRSQDQRRAARVLDHRRRAGGCGRHPAQPQGRRAQAAQPRRGAAQPAQAGRERGDRGRHRGHSRCRDHQSRITSSRTWRRAASSTCRSRSSRAAATCPRPSRAGAKGRPADRQHRAGRLLQPGQAGELRGRERAGRAAHRPRQADHGRRDQRRHRARRGDPLRGARADGPAVDCSRTSRARRSWSSSRRRRRSIRSCCVRWTIWS